MFAIIKFISKKNKDSHQTKIIKIRNFTHWKTLFAISYLIQEKRKKSSYKWVNCIQRKTPIGVFYYTRLWEFVKQN